VESSSTTSAAGHIPAPPRRPVAHRFASELARVAALDPPAERLLGLLGNALRPGALRDALSGTPLGHALHPLLTDLPIGAWTSATILDATGGGASAPAARRLIGVGILAALPTAASGWVEWGDSAKARPATRRVGLVHAAANVAALTLYGASYLRRRGGHGGRALAFAGAGALAVGGHLGGHLAYVHGEGVAETTFEDGPREWVPTVPLAELTDGRMTCVEAAGVPVLLVLRDGVAYALANRCTHRGGALHEGELEGDRVVCPLHGSRFALDAAVVERGPAASPQPAYETRVRDGRVEVRQSTDPTP
jgi:nitrite reductase/ring-hydroxylating ferredoxin subunit/uncharacterized membrane protein